MWPPPPSLAPWSLSPWSLGWRGTLCSAWRIRACDKVGTLFFTPAHTMVSITNIKKAINKEVDETIKDKIDDAIKDAITEAVSMAALQAGWDALISALMSGASWADALSAAEAACGC